MADNTGSPAYADARQRYRLDSRIATGGMGEVWRATDTVLDRLVAVKLLRREHADDPVFRSRFETEAQHAAGLHHPGVAQVFDFGTGEAVDDHPPYLVMEYVDGKPLSAILRPGQPMDPAAAARLVAETGDALGAAHAQGIVHRDVKPANILVTEDRQVKITDFGIARALEETMVTQIGTVLGTMRYLSPEQAEGRVVGTEADVYSLGVVFDELLEGSTDSDRAVIDRMRASEPAERPSAGEVAASFGVTQVLRPARAEHRPGLATRTKVLAAGAAVAIVAAIVIATTGGSGGKTRVEPVPHAATPAQQARNLSAWLKTYSG
jgi:eukaryotic-like serine/threonine-protein kinase